MKGLEPSVLVFSSLFPHPGQPQAGLFIRERMFQVARRMPLCVVAPVPWFPGQGLIRLFRPHFRPSAPRVEVQDGIEVHHPRFFSFPGMLKCLDGLLLALSTYPLLRRLSKSRGFDLIDAHFAYPDGYAATLLGRWLGKSVSITLRGTEVRLLRTRCQGRLLRKALTRARQLFAVSASLRDVALAQGVVSDKIITVGNAVDTEKFFPVDKAVAREALGLPPDAEVLVSVGGLVPRKGFHRVIQVLAVLVDAHPRLHYLIVGGASAEGDIGAQLRAQVSTLGLADRVHFTGPIAHADLHKVLSAADVFVLATTNEGWANVLLEAMACGLPIVTTRVGGNAEVVREPDTGILVPAEDAQALQQALQTALDRRWDRSAIIAYARANAWSVRVDVLCERFRAMLPAELKI